MIRTSCILLGVASAFLLTPAVRGAGLTTATYDFTATLNQSLGGSNQVSGSFTFYETIPGLPAGSYTEQGDNGLPFTLNFANQSTSTGASGINSLKVSVGSAASMETDYIVVNTNGHGDLNLGGVPLSAAITLQDRSGGFFPTANGGGDLIPIMTLADFPINAIALVVGGSPANGGNPQYVYGSLTSLQFMGTSDGSSIPTSPLSTPEPSTFVIFGLLGAGGLVAHRRSLNASNRR